MNKIYHLSTCDTCKRILKELGGTPALRLQDIKKEPVTPEELEQLRAMAGSYEALFNKRAKLYKERDLKNKELGEEQYRDLLLEHYTFLKRPVIVKDGKIFVGNSRKTVEEAKKALNE